MSYGRAPDKPRTERHFNIEASREEVAESLWLFSASGSLHVMRTGPDGQRIHTSDDGVDQDFIVETIDIPNDGGDW